MMPSLWRNLKGADNLMPTELALKIATKMSYLLRFRN
uniref:Uncharacterized protein n=1 Tax=Aegilops tauschii subsp. strangulata TaxID=200361 RepID=A0A453NCH1_AEGTS